MTAPGIFLTAEWRHLAMLNYEVDPALLAAHVPRGTELDTWDGRTFVSLVGFRFINTRILGLPIPFHRHFEEVNLRFYVRRHAPEGWRRGVVFLREIVPRAAIAAVARQCYNEPYVALPMRHAITPSPAAPSPQVEYAWQFQGRWIRLRAETAGTLQSLQPGSAAEFITEHYWGYTAQRDGGCLEYQVEHPRWRVWSVAKTSLEGDCAAFYGPEFSAPLTGEPSSAFVADGSPVSVRRGVRLERRNFDL